MILRALAYLGRHAPPILAASIFVGLALPSLAALCQAAIVPSVYLLLVVSVLRLDWPAVARHARRPGPALLALLWLLIVSPLIMAAVVATLKPPPALATALVLTAAAPPIMSSIAFALLFGLDAALAVVTLVATLLVVPFTLPPLALRLLGLDLPIELVTFITRLAYLVGCSLLAAIVIRRVAGAERIARHASVIDGLAVVVLLVFALGIMAGITDRIVASPGKVALWVISAFVANLGMQAMTGLIFAWLGTPRALTLALMSGNRNSAILIAVLAGRVEFDILMFLALTNLPIYILPAALAPLYRWFLNRQAREC
jgi:BASS family bile acid:Na+ symporter